MINASELAAIKSRILLSSLVRQSIALRKNGNEFRSICPFHNEKTPSFTVVDGGGFYHCFGCGAHGDHIAWLVDYLRLDFLAAVERLRAWTGSEASTPRLVAATESLAASVEWSPIEPVPRDAPALNFRQSLRIYNPKRSGSPGEWMTARASLVHSYKRGDGELLGYVLRIDGPSGKFTPTITYCRNAAGICRWCIFPFSEPRPLYGLDRLAGRPLAKVVLSEGEKTADAIDRLLPGLVSITWPGGSNGFRRVDWAPLAGRDVICIPDADGPGRAAFQGRVDGQGVVHEGLLDILAQLGARVRYVEPPADLPDGWDLADAESAGWSSVRVIEWLKAHWGPLREGGTARSAQTEEHALSSDSPLSEWFDVVGKPIKGAARRDLAATISAQLVRRFVDPFLALELVRGWNALRCAPPLEDDDLTGVVDAAAARQLAREIDCG